MVELEKDFRIYTLRDSKFWGPLFWNYLYLKVLGLPSSLSVQQANELVRFFRNFHFFLPCIDCRRHYYHMVKDREILIETRQDAFDFVLTIHNEIRERQKKEKLTQDMVIDYFYKKKVFLSDETVYFIIPAMCLILLITIFLKKYNFY